jgi:uncharacterized protein YjbJ (UPF0337 family)
MGGSRIAALSQIDAAANGNFRVAERCHPSWRSKMDSEHIKGAADKAKGAIKDTAGKLTGDKELQSEGKLDKAKGAVHDAVGNVKDAARDLAK